MTKLLSDWRIIDVDPDNLRQADLVSGRGDGWIAVKAPGDTYLALVAAGRIKHPFRGRGAAAARWVRHRQWWWHTRFDGVVAADGERVELVFDGLDTFAEIYVDGALIGSSDNMFRQLGLDITAVAGSGEHDLAVCFQPTAAIVGDRDLPTWKNFSIFNQERRALIRKAQFGWGWDFGPDLPTVGIWKPVRIERRRQAAVTGLNFKTLSITCDVAAVRVDVELSASSQVAIELLDPDGAVVASGTRQGSGALILDVAQPRLWWTADLGGQPLYTLVARTDGTPGLSRRVGIRTVAIDESPDPDERGATFFRFVLNGVPIFARGACWIPASSFVGAIADETCRDRVALAARANMNMIRVWGGGIYESDAFYDACDASGLLVWQDFMFACAAYPEDDAFVANVRAEVAGQVRRLRSHPCLAVWCGNNENELLNHFDNYLRQASEPLPGGSLFKQHIPEVLGELDPITPYRPGSPWGGPAPNSMRAGDVHDWTVWHGAAPIVESHPIGPLISKSAEGIAYTRYAEDMARFVSEFGLHGSPELATLRRWLAPEDLELGSEGFRDRTKDTDDKAGMMASLLTGRPAGIGEYVDFTMLVQAEGLKFGIEHFRRRKPHCSGALIWQYHDCWPCVSWSLIDYDGIPKAGYFAAKRGYAPVLASFRRVEGDAVELWITNDTLAPVADVASVTLARLNGGEDWCINVPFEIDANNSAMVWQGQISAANDRVLSVRTPSAILSANRLLLVPIKDLALAADAGLQWTVEGTRLTVSARRYALSVRVTSSDPLLRVDDNYFDLTAGESRTISASHAIDPSTIAVSSWADRYRSTDPVARRV